MTNLSFQPAEAAMALSLVIPVWNDRAGLDRLLQQVGCLGIFAEIIIVDDASDSVLSQESLPGADGLLDRITWLRSDTQRGAGHARNIGLQRVQSSHVIFFDSDDMFGADFAQIVEMAQQETFDFLIFRHNDSRLTRTGTFPEEEKYWHRIHAKAELTPLSSENAAVLCRLAAYPWNKIYRTDFLRDNQIRCTETMVHNDIELHWSSFIAAKRILCSALIGAEHFVLGGGSRLTNRRSAERLEVFHAFRNVLSRLQAQDGRNQLRFLTAFIHFMMNLIKWIEANLDDAFHAALREQARVLLIENLNRDQMTIIAYENPALGSRINKLIAKGTLS